MVFSSLFFLFVFLSVVLGVYYMLKPLPIILRNIWLFFVSLFFYAWGEPYFVLAMLLSILVNYGFGILIEAKKNSKYGKVCLGVAVTMNLLLLFVMKYLNFSISIIDVFLKDLIPVTHIALPIGISFFTFQSVSYLVDVYRGDGSAQKNPLYVGLYISLFPQLVAGPIVRYSTVAAQMTQRKESLSDFGSGVERFVIGFCKKIMLANTFAVIADVSFSSAWKGETISVAFAWMGAISYSLQILFDFAGYSDMAIGLGRMFGFHFEENFNYPYAANSITDFWRRWHISLGTWFRDYVYIPLGGSRVKKGRLIFNLFVVWMLTGIWHGANWTFVLWGFFYFVLLTLEKLTGIPGKLKCIWQKILYRVLTLLGVLFGWVIFRAQTPGTVLRYVKAMLFMGNGSVWDGKATFYLRENWLYFLIAVILCIPLKIWSKKEFTQNKVLAVGKPIALMLLFVISITYLVVNAYNPFIYFNF